MALVNKFNVNNTPVKLDVDIIENMSANDVSYNDSVKYDENTVGSKLSELEGIKENKEYKSNDFMQGRFYGAIIGGIVSTDDNKYCLKKKIEVVEGETVSIKVKGWAGNAQAWSTEDSNGIIKRVAVNTANILSETITIQKDEKYINICSHFNETFTHDELSVNSQYEKEGKVSLLEKDIKLLSNDVSEIQKVVNGVIQIDKSIFEIGNITINNQGWTYGFGGKRVRTKEGSTIKLLKGTTIALKSYEDARFFIGCRKEDGTYISAGWLTKDYECQFDGDYVLLLSNITEVSQTSIDALFNLLLITSKDNVNNLFGKVDNISSKIRNTNFFVNNKGIIVRHASANRCGVPANTKKAITLCGLDGIVAIENDVRKSLDGVFVLWHNDTITIDGTDVAVEDTTYSNLLKYTYSDEQKICTLEEELQICQKFGMKLLCELKQSATTTHPWNTSETLSVANMCENYLGLDNFVLMSMQKDLLASIRDSNKTITIMYLTSQPSPSLDILIKDGGYTMVGFNYKSYINNTNGMINYVKSLEDNDIPVGVWTVEGVDTSHILGEHKWNTITSNTTASSANGKVISLYNSGLDFATTDKLDYNGHVENGILVLNEGEILTYSLEHFFKSIFECCFIIASGEVNISDVNNATPIGESNFGEGCWKYCVSRGQNDWLSQFTLTANTRTKIVLLTIKEVI